MTYICLCENSGGSGCQRWSATSRRLAKGYTAGRIIEQEKRSNKDALDEVLRPDCVLLLHALQIPGVARRWRESPRFESSLQAVCTIYIPRRGASPCRGYLAKRARKKRDTEIFVPALSPSVSFSLSLCRLINDYRETCLAWPLREIQPRPRRAYNTHPRCTRCMYIARIKGQPWCPSLFFLPSTCFALFLNTHFFFFLPFPNVEESLRTIRRVFGTNFRRFGCFLPVWRFIQIL